MFRRFAPARPVAGCALAMSSLVSMSSCSSDSETPPQETSPCAAAQITPTSRFPEGSADGHTDPFGARAAGQARAGRPTDLSLIEQPADRRNPIRPGDYVLVNDRVAVFIDRARASEGYDPFGGEIVAMEPIGENGRPTGQSIYGETLLMFSRQVLRPDSVTVLADGSDGKEAIIRASGRLDNVPFLDEFRAAFPDEFDLPAALDYVLAPGSERILVRLHLMNPTAEAIDFATRQNAGFFQTSRARLFTPNEGYAPPKGESPFAVFDGSRYGFAFRLLGRPLAFGLELAGFQYFQASGLTLDACATSSTDYAEFVAAGPGLDTILTALARVDGKDERVVVKGRVEESDKAPVPGAFVLSLGADGRVVSRTESGPSGEFELHAPPTGGQLVVVKKGWATPNPTPVDGRELYVLELATHGTLVVRARDAGNGVPLPVRVQVIPETPPSVLPVSWGVVDEINGRLHQDFATSGESRLPVFPGKHRVIVSRGYEYEILDTTVEVARGATVEVDAPLAHSVESTGVMCADLHIHSANSVDSSDPVEFKVRGAIADGLEIPVSSEHDFAIDFQPVIERLGLKAWAFGVPSSELTTFAWGHFGVVPLVPKPELRNQGAIEWTRRTPAEVFAEVHALPEAPLLVVNHPRSLGPLGAYFEATRFDPATARGDETYSPTFDAVEVFNESNFESNRDKTVKDWFGLLDAGQPVVAVGSSDSHALRTQPIGYPRTCLQFGHDDPTRLSQGALRDTLKKGAAIVSGGLTMTVSGPAGEGPGDTVPSSSFGGSALFRVVVRTPSWLEAEKVEVIVDGQTVETRPLVLQVGEPPAKRYLADVPVAPTSSRSRHWVVFHATSPAGRDLTPVHPGKRPFAVSNPIYF